MSEAGQGMLPAYMVAAFDQSPNPVGMIRDGQYIDGNAAMIELLGLESREELIGAEPGGRFSTKCQPDGQDSRAAGRAYLEKCLECGNVEFYWTSQRGNGEQFNSKVVLRRLDKLDPSVVVVYIQDVTELVTSREAILESEKRFSDLARNAPVGIFIADAEGNCLYSNPKAREKCGVGEDEMGGTGWSRHLHPEDRDSLFSRWRTFTAGGKPLAMEYRFRFPGGSISWMALSAVPFTDRRFAGPTFLGCITDITTIKEIEAELEASRNEALRANNAKSEFLSRMSHELRTPMNAILGFGQLLKMKNPDLAEDQLDAVNQILSGGEQLLELIEDILDFSRIDSGHISLNVGRVCTSEIIERSLALVEPLAGQLGVNLETGATSAPDVIADSHRMQQVLVNLLTNAIKYNNRGGRVGVRAERSGDGGVRIHVIDSGEGIRPEDRSRLFRPFERISGAVPKVEGTGIGLSLSKQLIELMGGMIDFQSEPGKGSDFWVELMAAEKDGAAAGIPAVSAPTADSTPAPGVRILYVEDQLASIQLMMEVTRNLEHCTITTATNAADGIAIAKSDPPDLMLLDINLTGMDGMEALQKLKSDSRTRDVPVIALSASALSEVIEEGTRAGFERFLLKPLRLEKLLDAIRSVALRKVPVADG